ncbi:MAG: DinB family protein, partial [Chlorobi bacterium]|nr:DinB family protein [Chlorobiota bacterium]
MNNIEIFTVYNFNHGVIHTNTEGLTHEDSLKSPAEGGNSINWVIGHILVSRDNVNELLGLPKICSEDMINFYKRGSKPITSMNAVKLEKLLEMLNESQKKLEEKIQQIDLKDDEQRARKLAFYSFH